MEDLAKIRDFVKYINVDGRHEGARISAVGSFITQQLEGVARLAGSPYQFVIEDGLALVATIPDRFVPAEGTRYRVSGVLRNSGEFTLFPGIEIDDIADA